MFSIHGVFDSKTNWNRLYYIYISQTTHIFEIVKYKIDENKIYCIMEEVRSCLNYF